MERRHSGLDVVRVFCAADGTGGNPLGVFLDGGAISDAERQPIAAELGFSETVFVDDLETGELRIFTPGDELALAGHPLVGTAWLMRERGSEPAMLRPPAGEVPVRFEGELTWVTARPEWSPPWEFERAGSAVEIDSMPADGGGRVETGVWAWLDEEAGIVRERVFVNAAGIAEDEATGSAALMLCAQLGREIEIRQGEGSVIWARPLEGGFAEVGGCVRSA
jgi:predicted PhzF superfamily epimerase YddE/YHI9